MDIVNVYKLEDGPINWLEDDDDAEELCKILKKCEQNK